ncbi:hypothetical protein KQX54_017489 [Cotesia glomerata]|uniref:Invertebrate defensins family profile domain-containing protein n=1 Tax=Cotesia glomerata TaxID=32391 RepID=A0AAV7HW45_COTGL|nr:hypothetical protein KQX54_017489 [Cotesia glomerata]
MAKSYSSMLLLVCLTFLVIVSSPKNEVQADVSIGHCSPIKVNYYSDCPGECKSRGYKGGHCGSLFNHLQFDVAAGLLDFFGDRLFLKNEVQADVSIGHCSPIKVNYYSDCPGECKSRGYKGGHCGSLFNHVCWCDQ